MSIANPLWGAPRIHGELLKLGIDIGQTSVAKYMAKPRDPPSQGWRTFLRNHADGIAAMDLFVVPTISFRLLALMPLVFRRRRRIFRNREVLMPGGSDLMRRCGLVGIFRGCAGRCPRVGAVSYQQGPGNNGERRYRGNKQFAHCSLHLTETTQTEQARTKSLDGRFLSTTLFGVLLSCQMMILTFRKRKNIHRMLEK
jgi:hypothetical protein